MANRPYSIRLDAQRRLLQFEVEGFWPVETVADFRAELFAALRPLVTAGQTFDLLADFSRYPPQARAVSEQMQESLIRGADLGMRRVACVVSSAVTRLQFARVAASQNFRFFASTDGAIAWLREDAAVQGQQAAPNYDFALRSTSITAI